MGWYHGMTQEEIEEQFGRGGGATSTCPRGSKQQHSTSEDQTSKISSSSTSNTSKREEKSNNSMNGVVTISPGITACPLPSSSSSPPPPPPDVQFIYHLCQKSKWEECVRKQKPYFPPTYMKDGKFTRASVNKEDIVPVANEYYKSMQGKWIVLELDCKLLYSLGIPILAQTAPESILNKESVKCLQIFGGITTTIPSLVHYIYPLLRNNSDGTFIKLLHGEPISTTKTADWKKNDMPEDAQGTKDLNGGIKRKGFLGRLKMR